MRLKDPFFITITKIIHMAKTCFIISSIGKEGTDIRKISDQKMRHVYEPVMKKLGYKVTRADKINNSGLINKDIVDHIIHDTIVIVDVTDENPNVFYELAIRNAVKKPVILFKRSDQELPFDIQNKRALSIDITNPDIWTKSLEELKNNVKNIELDPNTSSESILSEFISNITFNKLSNVHSYLKDEINYFKQEIKKTFDKELNSKDNPTSEILDKIDEEIKRENYIDAKTFIDFILEKNPNNIDALRRQGELQEYADEYEKAINIYDKILAIKPNDDSTYFRKALLFHLLENNGDALQCISKAIELNEESVYLTLKAEIILDGGDDEDALKIIEQALAFEEVFIHAWKVKGDILTKLNKPKEAKICYRTFKELEA